MPIKPSKARKSSTNGSQNARTHGLTARTPLPRQLKDIRALRDALLAGSCQTPEVIAAAEQVAHHAVLLSAINYEIATQTNLLLEGVSISGAFDSWLHSLPTARMLGLALARNPERIGLADLLDAEAAVDWMQRMAAERALSDIERNSIHVRSALGSRNRKLETLRVYARKSRSRLARAIQQLDYAKIECERHEGN